MPTLEEFMRVDRPWTRKEQQLIAAQSESQYNLRQKAVDLVRDQFIGSHALRQIQANWGEESVFGDTPWDPEAKPFVMTEEFLDELSRDDQGNPMPADYLGEFENARSPDHARQIRRGLLPLIESRNRLNQLGWGGIAARMAAAILDPVAITLEVATLGRATPAIYGGRASRLTKALKMGFVTSATVGGFEAALAGLDPERGATDVVYAAAGSFVMGAGLGRILDKRLTEAGRGVMRQQQFQEIRKIAGLELTPKGKKYYRTQLDPQAQTKAMRAAISQLDLHPEDAAALEEIVSNPEQLRHLMPDLNDTDTRTPSAQPPSQQDFVNGPVFVYDLNLTGRRTQPRYDPKTGNVIPDDPNAARVTISDEAAEVAPAAGEDVQQLARETDAALNAFIDKNPGMDPMAARAAFDATPEGKALNARLETARRTAAAPDEAAAKQKRQFADSDKRIKAAREKGDDKELAVQAWRLKLRADKANDTQRQQQVKDLYSELEGRGYTIDDPTGRAHVGDTSEYEVTIWQTDENVGEADELLTHIYVEKTTKPIIRKDGQWVGGGQVELRQRLKTKEELRRDIDQLREMESPVATERIATIV